MLAYIAAAVFVQRLVIVTAADDDPETARLAPQVEKFYNSELRRIRSNGRTPIEEFLTVLHLGLKDGTAPVDVLFTERIEPKLVVSEEPDVDDEGNVATDGGGMPLTKRVSTRIEEKIAEVSVIPNLLKDWYLLPAESRSISQAPANHLVVWMMEKEMREKVAAGIFKAESVDFVLDWVPDGTSDTASSENGNYDKDAGGQINIGLAQGSQTSKFFANRGPAQLIRTFSDQYDMDGDGIAEKNIFWHYAKTPLLIGWTKYEYVASEWPSLAFAPFPRPNQVPGYSLIERLADITAEANAGRNQRRNYIDLCLMPVELRREGDVVRDKDGAYYPGAPRVVESVTESLAWHVPPPLASDSFSDEARLDTYIAKLSGQNAPALGGQSSGRRTATESRQQQTAQTVRANLVAMIYRSFLRAVMQFWHRLNKQYLAASKDGPTTTVPHDLAAMYGGSPGAFTLSPDILARNFNIDIAGLSDPTDAGSRRQEIMGAIGVAQKAFPWIFDDPEKSFALAETFFETFQSIGLERVIGTAEQAKQRAEAAAQMAQQRAAMQQPGSQQPQTPHPQANGVQKPPGAPV
jgi:hypothetical protein